VGFSLYTAFPAGGFSFIPLPWGDSFLFRFPAWVIESYFFLFFYEKEKKK